MRQRFIASVLCFLCCLGISLAAQDLTPKARVAVATLANESADSKLDLVGRAVTDTIALSLRLMGSYSIESPPGLDEAAAVATAEALKAVAEANHLDSIVTGSVAKSAEDSFLFAVRLFDLQSGAFTIGASATAVSVLDVFDAADLLTKSFLESLSGMHVGFGSVHFENKGEKGDYIVKIDGVEAGRNLESLPKLLNGRYSIEVVQNRLLGELSLASIDAKIVEDEAIPISFDLPYMTEAERAKIDGLFEKADAATYDPLYGDASACLDELSAIVASAPWCPRWRELLPRLEGLRPAIAIMKVRFAIEASPLAPKGSDLEPLRALLAGLGNDEIARENRRLARETADIEATLLEYAAAAASGERDWAKVAAIYEDMKGILDLADPKVAGYYGARADAFGKALAAYLGNSIRSSQVAPRLLGGGLILAAAGAAVFAASIDSTFADKANSLLAQSQAANDSATVTSLHDTAYYYIVVANSARIGKWVGVTAGPLLAALGGTLAVKTDPARIFAEYAKGQFARSVADRARLVKALNTRMTNWVLLCPLSGADYRIGDSTRLAFPAVVRPSGDIAVRRADATTPLYVPARGKRSQGLLFVNPWKEETWDAPSLPAEVLPGWATTGAQPRSSGASGQKIASPSTSIASKSTSPFLRFSAGAFSLITLVSGDNLFTQNYQPTGAFFWGPATGLYFRILPSWYLGPEVLILNNIGGYNNWGGLIDILGYSTSSPWSYKFGAVVMPMNEHLAIAIQCGLGYSWVQGSLIGMFDSAPTGFTVSNFGLSLCASLGFL